MLHGSSGYQYCGKRWSGRLDCGHSTRISTIRLFLFFGTGHGSNSTVLLSHFFCYRDPDSTNYSFGRTRIQADASQVIALAYPPASMNTDSGNMQNRSWKRLDKRVDVVQYGKLVSGGRFLRMRCSSCFQDGAEGRFVRGCRLNTIQLSQLKTRYWDHPPRYTFSGRRAAAFAWGEAIIVLVVSTGQCQVHDGTAQVILHSEQIKLLG